MGAIYKREIKSYFTTMVGYIYMAIFFLVSAFFFMRYTVQAGENADVSSYFTIILYLFVVIIPLITMKLVSEERKMKTDQLLLTSPVSLWGMMIAKFLAAFTLFGSAFLISSLIYYIPLATYGSPNFAIYAGSVFAILLVGMAFISIGIFISSLTENQFIAAFGTIASIVILLMIDQVSSFINSEFIRTVISNISVTSRYANFAKGIFDYASLFYFISISALFLFLSVRVFEKRRWS